MATDYRELATELELTAHIGPPTQRRIDVAERVCVHLRRLADSRDEARELVERWATLPPENRSRGRDPGDTPSRMAALLTNLLELDT